MSDSCDPPGLSSLRLLCPWISPGKKYWSGLPFPSPGDLPDPGIQPTSLALKVDSLPLSHHLWPSVIECVYTKSLQSWPTLCDPMDCSLPGSSVHGIFQARILEWVARGLPLLQGIFLTQGLNPCQDWTHVSYIAGGFFTAELQGKP